jgi:serine/threonine protein kinase
MIHNETADYVNLSIPRQFGNYTIRKVIGQGMTSAVLEALNSNTGKDYAIKVMSYSDLEDRNILPMVERELTMLRRLSHPNVLHFHEFLRQGDLLLIVTEHCNDGDLLSWILDGRLNEKLTVASFL